MWQQVVISDSLGVIELIILDLVQINSLSKLVSLAPRNHGHLVLAGKVGNHTRSHRRNHTTITQHVVSVNKHFSGAGDETTNRIYKSVLAVHSIVRQSLQQLATLEGRCCVNDDHSELGSLLDHRSEKIIKYH